MNKLFLLVLLCLPLAAFANFNICTEDEITWYECSDFQVVSANVSNETENADSTTVTGENTQTNKGTSMAEYLETDPTNLMALTVLQEVGWRS